MIYFENQNFNRNDFYHFHKIHFGEVTLYVKHKMRKAHLREIILISALMMSVSSLIMLINPARCQFNFNVFFFSYARRPEAVMLFNQVNDI